MLVQHNVTILHISREELSNHPEMEDWLRKRCEVIKDDPNAFVIFGMTETIEKLFNKEFDIVDGKGETCPQA